jgi:hypothetical protein
MIVSGVYEPAISETVAVCITTAIIVSGVYEPAISETVAVCITTAGNLPRTAYIL